MNTPFSEGELKALWEKDREREMGLYDRMLKTGETYGVASGGHDFLNKPEDKFYENLKSIDNSLEQHALIVHKDILSYLKTGYAPAPYYAWRIAIILIKEKQKDKEKEFLQAWYRHFARLRNGSARYRILADRAEKRGIK